MLLPLLAERDPPPPVRARGRALREPLREEPSPPPPVGNELASRLWLLPSSIENTYLREIVVS